jgi:ABC-type enterobactin transport system permease subunit
MITALCFASCLVMVCGVAMGAAPYNLAGPIVAIIKPKHVANLLSRHFSKRFVLDCSIGMGLRKADSHW